MGKVALEQKNVVKVAFCRIANFGQGGIGTNKKDQGGIGTNKMGQGGIRTNIYYDGGVLPNLHWLTQVNTLQLHHGVIKSRKKLWNQTDLKHENNAWKHA